MTRLALCVVLMAAQASGADRPDEDAMFGGGEPASQPASMPASQASAAAVVPKSRDTAALEEPPTADGFLSGRIKDDALRIGGKLYMRGFTSFSTEQKIDYSRFSVPMLVDLYLDARPIDRLRAQVLGRLQYDPFLGTGLGISLPGASTSTPPANPAVALDQAWLAFDIAHAVFITAGRQHVKWGTARFFNPTDFLSAQFRDPLAQFDTRLGVTMLKMSVPWEAQGWNFTAVALFEPTQQPAVGLGTGSSNTNPLAATSAATVPPTTRLTDIGGAARIEVAFKGTQIGIDGLVQRNRKARGGLDITTAIGPLDFWAEGAIKAGSDVPVYRKIAQVNPRSAVSLAAGYEAYAPAIVGQVAGGLSYDIALPESKTLSFMGEYFFNSIGYSNPEVYPVLAFNGAFQPFYNGVHYGALSAVFNDSNKKVTAILSNIGNFSDLSFITRIDCLVTILNHLQLEAFVGFHYGRRGGEFRFAMDIDAEDVVNPFTGELIFSVPQINVVAPLIDIGIGLRVAL
ncbi:MAG: hypothetical protein IT381_29955 [Deltaproteobacteria bacterium]|nr:hypothetical protein [Deltaproteobacteria bacterium]